MDEEQEAARQEEQRLREELEKAQQTAAANEFLTRVGEVRERERERERVYIYSHCLDSWSWRYNWCHRQERRPNHVGGESCS